MSRSAPDGRPILFFDRGCPYTHRVLALLEHLGVAFDRREAMVGSKPDGLEQYSRAGRVPLLSHGELTLTESRIILDYLAERYRFDEAYPTDLLLRTRHRHAIAVANEHLTPLLFRRATADDEARIADALDALERATAPQRARESMLTMHLGPLWHSFRSWRAKGAVSAAVKDRASLHRWLETAAELPCVTRTATTRDVIASDLRRARDAGLITDAVYTQATMT